MTEPSQTVPLWLLDVDGVVNALGTAGDTWPAHEWCQRVVPTTVPGRGSVTLPILAARPVLAFVTAVHASGAAEIRWHSTWRAAAITGLAPAVGLPPIPISIAPEWDDATAPGWWKLAAAQRAVASGRRLLWTDDEIDARLADEQRDAARPLTELASDDRALLVSPDPRAGLARQDLDAIAAFLGVGPDGRPT